MRYLLIILISFLALGACAQVPVIQRAGAGQVVLDQRPMAGLNFYLPRVLGKPILRPSLQNGGVDTLGAMVFNILDSSYYKWIGGNIWEKDYNPRDTINTLATQSYVNRHGGSGAAIWGQITGNIVNQTDLFNILVSKVNYTDTINGPVATRTYVNSQGFLKTETDPIAQAKMVTLTGGYGVIIPGSGTGQTIGNNPSFGIGLDTTAIMPFTDTLKVITGIATKSWGYRNFIPWSDTGRGPSNIVTGGEFNWGLDSLAFNSVISFNGRQRIVVPTTGDYNYSQVTNAAGLPANQTFTGSNAFNGSTSINNGLNLFGLFNGASTDSLLTIIGGVVRKVPSTTYLQNITGYISAGTNVGITGLGTFVSPYVISSSGGTGGGSVTNVSTGYGIKGGPITVSGTLTADTIFMATRSALDSVAALIVASNTITNVGAGNRAVLTNLNQVRTFFGGYGQNIDSTSNSNGLTFTSDTTKLIPYTDTSKIFGVITRTQLNAALAAFVPTTQGAFRVSPIDSGSVNSANGITITGVNLRPQYANYIHPGFLSDTLFSFLDSLRLGLKIDSINVSDAGSGLWAIFARNGGVVGKTVSTGYGLGVTTQPDSTLLFTADTTKLIAFTDTLKTGGIATQTFVLNHSGGGSGNNQAIYFPYGGRNGPPTLGGDSSYTNTSLIGKYVAIQLVQKRTLTSMPVVDSTLYVNNGGIYTSPWFSYNPALGRIVFHNFTNISSLQNDSFWVVIFPGQGFPGIIDLGTAPILGATPSSLTGFTTNTSTPSTSQTFALTGTNLTNNAILTAPPGFQISTNNSTWFGALSVTQSGGAIPSTTIFVRLDTVVANSYSGNISITSSPATPVTVTASGTVNAIVSAIYNFSATAASVSGATNFFGDPTTSLSFTDPSSGWTLVNIPGNWIKYGGSFFGNNSIGVTTGSQSGTFTATMGNNDMYTGSTSLVDTTTTTIHTGIGPHLRFTNLPAGTYDITMWGSCPQSFFNTGGNPTIYGVEFGTGNTLQYSHSFDPNGTGTFNTMEVGAGSHFISSGSFTGTITSGQTIDIFIGSGTIGVTAGTVADIINCLKITKH